jgi:hypothetical protein
MHLTQNLDTLLVSYENSRHWKQSIKRLDRRGIGGELASDDALVEFGVILAQPAERVRAGGATMGYSKRDIITLASRAIPSMLADHGLLPSAQGIQILQPEQFLNCLDLIFPAAGRVSRDFGRPLDMVPDAFQGVGGNTKQCNAALMKRLNEQVCLRLARPLRNSLEQEAAARGRTLSNLIQQILVAHSAKWNVKRARAATEQRSAA